MTNIVTLNHAYRSILLKILMSDFEKNHDHFNQDFLVLVINKICLD